MHKFGNFYKHLIFDSVDSVIERKIAFFYYSSNRHIRAVILVYIVHESSHFITNSLTTFAFLQHTYKQKGQYQVRPPNTITTAPDSKTPVAPYIVIGSFTNENNEISCLN